MLELTLDANADRLERQHNEYAWLAWHIAALGRTKKMPALKKLQSNAKKLPLDKQLDNLVRWVAATGGKVIVKPRDKLNG